MLFPGTERLRRIGFEGPVIEAAPIATGTVSIVHPDGNPFPCFLDRSLDRRRGCLGSMVLDFLVTNRTLHVTLPCGGFFAVSPFPYQLFRDMREPRGIGVSEWRQWRTFWVCFDQSGSSVGAAQFLAFEIVAIALTHKNPLFSWLR
jgi:hypothetical protein